MKRKYLVAILSASLAVSMLAGCSSDPDAGSSKATTESAAATTTAAAEVSTEAATQASTEAKADDTGVTLEVETTWTNENLDALTEIMNDFTAQTGINVELVAPGDDYENVMKTRMASNDLPDLFETHGWSTTRYKEYLAPLDDEPWVKDVKSNIKTTVTADDGSIYVLPLSIDPASICYNIDLFEKAGVTATDIRTWADFEDACEKLKASGVTPVYVGGNNVNNIANLFEVTAPGFLLLTKM
jgi:raffinose/stachyose/melibiose transport system substrate-binding protein